MLLCPLNSLLYLLLLISASEIIDFTVNSKAFQYINLEFPSSSDTHLLRCTGRANSISHGHAVDI